MKERENSPRILTGSYDIEFAKRVADCLSLPLEIPEITRFANGELKAEVLTAVRDDYVFVIQSHGEPVSDTLLEHFAIVNAAHQASAGDVTAVTPYRAYGRADRPDNSHESYMGPLTMQTFITAGANRIMEVDPHAGQSAGFIACADAEYTPLPAYPAVRKYLETQFFAYEDQAEVVIASPDSGRAKMNRHYADHYGSFRAIVDKVRVGANKVEASDVVGDVKGRHCIMIDDMIDTAGTIVQGAEALLDHGASRVDIVATHGILSDPALERLESAKTRGVIASIAVTDTLRLPSHAPDGLIEVISVAPIVARAIRSIFDGTSVSDTV